MSESNDDLEQALESHFAQERERTTAPADLSSRVEAKLGAETAPRSIALRRWPALVATVVAAAAIATGLFVVSSYLGGEGAPTADEVLASAQEASAHPDRVGLESYQGRAEITGPVDEDSEMTVEAYPEGKSRTDGSVEPQPEIARASMEVAFEAPARYHVDVEGVEPPIVSGERSLLVGDGSSFWSYESRSNTYTRQDADDPSGFAAFQYYLTPGAFFGGGGIAGLIEGLRSHTDAQAVIASEETLLGRPVYVLEIRPAYQGSRSSANGTEEDYSGGVVRMWLDKEYLFALRTQVPDGEDGGVVEINFTEIKFNDDIDDALFEFTPPPGAREVQSVVDTGFTSSGGAIGGGEIGLPAPFLSPTDLPGGYAGRSSGTSSDSSGTYFSARFLIVGEEDGYVRGEERVRADGMPESLRTGTLTSVNGNEAWSARTEDALSLAWQDGNIVTVLTTNRVTEEELRRMAASMQVRAGTGDSPAIEEEPSSGEQPDGEAEAVPAQPDAP